MGLKDEDYRKALEEKQRQLQVEYIKLQMEKQKEEARMLRTSPVHNNTNAIASNGTGMVIINQGGQTTTFTNSGTYTQPLNTSTTTGTWASQTSIGGGGGLRPITEVDLKHDAMQAPLSALVDMWTVRWQGEWVNEAEFDNDDFWRLALIRLMGANKLEKHNLANQYRSVYRIIE